MPISLILYDVRVLYYGMCTSLYSTSVGYMCHTTVDKPTVRILFVCHCTGWGGGGEGGGGVCGVGGVGGYHV